MKFFHTSITIAATIILLMNGNTVYPQLQEITDPDTVKQIVDSALLSKQNHFLRKLQDSDRKKMIQTGSIGFNYVIELIKQSDVKTIEKDLNEMLALFSKNESIDHYKVVELIQQQGRGAKHSSDVDAMMLCYLNLGVFGLNDNRIDEFLKNTITSETFIDTTWPFLRGKELAAPKMKGKPFVVVNDEHEKSGVLTLGEDQLDKIFNQNEMVLISTKDQTNESLENEIKDKTGRTELGATEEFRLRFAKSKIRNSTLEAYVMRNNNEAGDLLLSIINNQNEDDDYKRRAVFYLDVLNEYGTLETYLIQRFSSIEE